MNAAVEAHTAAPLFPLTDAQLDDIAHLARVSRATVSRVLFLRGLFVETRDLLARAVRANASAREIVYFLQAEGDGRIKIGTTKDLRRRLRVLRAGSPVRLRLIAMVRGGRDLERMLHLAFASLRRGRTEWFEPGERLVSYVRGLRKREVGR